MLSWGIQVVGVVSDRAKALVKMGDSDYLGVCSMPDLFHFMQDIGKLLGLQLGKKRAAALKALQNAKDGLKAGLKKEFERIDATYQKYRQQIQQINKTIHPFNEADEFQLKGAVEKGLLHCFTAIGQLGVELGIAPKLDKATKVLNQINPISQAVDAWIVMAKSTLEDWVKEELINQQEQLWLISCALPYVYWQLQLNRTPAKARNKDLRDYYKKRIKQAQQNALNHQWTNQLQADRKQQLLLMAHQLAISFQRASSQTEGRNGYLAFINHAHKGLPQGRLEVLTVIHNYDIRRADNSTPAQRLFGRDFSDLFEFIVQNVTGFKEPRKKNRRALTINNLQP